MTDIDFDELDKAVNSLMSKQRAAENKTDAGEDTASGVSLASGSENGSEFASSTVSSVENASTDPAPAPVNNNVGGNIPVSVSHSSPAMQTSDSQDAEASAAKIGTEAPKPSPNTEAEANAVKVTTVSSVPVSSPTSSVPVAASVAGQPSVPARSLTPSASPVPSAATNVKPPTVSSAPAASSTPVAAPSTSTTPSATTASAAPIAATAPAATTNPPTPAPSSVPLSSSSSPNSVVTPAAQRLKPAASTVSISPASTTPAVPSAPSSPSSSSSSSTASPVDSPGGHKLAVTPAVSPSPAAPPESETVHVSPMIAKRPHGRFMDVVHPSSKSKLVQQRKMTPNASTSGLGGQSGADSANKDDSANLADKGVRRSSMIGGGNNLNSNEDNSGADTPTSANSEKSLLSSAKKRVVLPQNPESKTNDSPDAATPVQSKSESTAPVSPFISNVEVEKRPLGTPAAATDDANDGSAAIAKNDDHKKSLANYTPRKLDVSEDDPDDEVEPGGDVGLPPEFSADVMAAEEADVSSLDAAVDDIKAAEQRASKKPSDNDDVSLRHSPKKDSTEPEPKPMFDAASRTSKNFDPKEESKSGWLTVLLILLFLAIGVAGGAAAYFLLIK